MVDQLWSVLVKSHGRIQAKFFFKKMSFLDLRKLAVHYFLNLHIAFKRSFLTHCMREADKETARKHLIQSEASNTVWTATENKQSLWRPFKLVNNNGIWTMGKNCCIQGTRTSRMSYKQTAKQQNQKILSFTRESKCRSLKLAFAVTKSVKLFGT